MDITEILTFSIFGAIPCSWSTNNPSPFFRICPAGFGKGIKIGPRRLGATCRMPYRVREKARLGATQGWSLPVGAKFRKKGSPL